MITLEQLVKDQKWTGMSDIQIIKTFFNLNNMEEEGIEITEVNEDFDNNTIYFSEI